VDQLSKIYELSTPVVYNTSNGPVQCKYGVKGMSVAVRNKLGNKVILSVSGTVAPEGVNIP